MYAMRHGMELELTRSGGRFLILFSNLTFSPYPVTSKLELGKFPVVDPTSF